MLSRILGWIRSKAAAGQSQPRVTDFEKVELLDAEGLAEQGIKEAYDTIVGNFPNYFPNPATVEEFIDKAKGSYSVVCLGETFEICRGEDSEWERESWGRATYALFRMLNAQLNDGQVKFYAINGGNDLCGVFLTPPQRDAACTGLTRREDWPYIPTEETPWFGML